MIAPMLSEVFVLKCREGLPRGQWGWGWGWNCKGKCGWTFRKKWSFWSGFFEWRKSNVKNITTKQSAMAWLGNARAEMKRQWQQTRHILMMIY